MENEKSFEILNCDDHRIFEYIGKAPRGYEWVLYYGSSRNTHKNRLELHDLVVKRKAFLKNAWEATIYEVLDYDVDIRASKDGPLVYSYNLRKLNSKEKEIAVPDKELLLIGGKLALNCERKMK